MPYSTKGAGCGIFQKGPFALCLRQKYGGAVLAPKPILGLSPLHKEKTNGPDAGEARSASETRRARKRGAKETCCGA